MSKSAIHHVAFGLLLAAVVWLVYFQVRNHAYLNLDDDVYILKNPHVSNGLSMSALHWAFTRAHEAYWLPLTWISFMLDIELFGVRAGPQLLVNVALHTVNSLLLYGVLVGCTGQRWASAWVAAVFALHPLRMESVAWVSQRKDVLSTLFWLLTTLAYVRYVRQPSPRAYLASLFTFVLGLLAKPMLVTLPVVLLLMDYWPLRRTETPARRLLGEKLPFFAIAGVAAVVTIVTQAGAGAVPEIATVPLDARLANAAVAYVRYLGKLLYPTNLAIFYPLTKVPIAMGAAAAAAIVAITLVAFRARARRPSLWVGWAWFLVTLLPVIGLLQVGGQALADRYTYVPSIGLLIAVAFALGDVAGTSRFLRGSIAVAGVATVLACALLTYRGLRHWQDSVSVFTRAVATTEGNFLAHNNLGEALMQLGRVQEAGAHYATAVEIHPGYPEARNNYGVFLAEQGRYDAAEEQFRAALSIRPELAGAESNIATIRLRLGDLDGAVAHYERALTLDPANPDAHYSYGDTLALLDRPQEAILHYEAALRLRPDWPAAQSALDRARGALDRGGRDSR